MKSTASLVILAAGMGSRFGGDKQIVPLSCLQWPLLRFTLFDAWLAGIRHVVIITRTGLVSFFERDIFPNFPDVRFDIVCQDQVEPKRAKPWGTGHAALCAKSAAQERFFIINADDFYGRKAIAQAVHFLESKIDGQYGCIGYSLANTLSLHGAVSRGIIRTDENDHVQSIDEYIQIQKHDDGQIYAVEHRTQQHVVLPNDQPTSLNLFAFDRSVFDVLQTKFEAFLEKQQESETAEFFLPSSVTSPDVLQHHVMHMIPTQDHWLGLTYANDLLEVEQQLNQLIDQGRYH